MARNSYSKRVKFFIFETIVLVPLLILVIFPSKTAFYVAIFAVAALWLLNKKGLDINMFSRKLRTMLIGRARYIRPNWRKDF